MPLAICQILKAEEVQMQQSLKNQTLLLCQNNLYLYTNKEIIINLINFALII